MMKGILEILLIPALGWLAFSPHFALAKDPTPSSDSDLVSRVSNDYGPKWIDGKTQGAKRGDEPAVPKIFHSQAVMPPLWIPMCFLFDSSADPVAANSKVRDLVNAYGSCGIAVEPFGFTLKPGYPNDFKAVKAAALAACPFNSTFHVRGAIQIETHTTEIAQQMCSDPQATGCSTLCEPTSLSFVSLHSGTASALHESMHGNCCGPACVNKGDGGGKAAGPGLEIASLWNPGRFNGTEVFLAEKDTAGAEVKISPEGCQALRAGASPNEFSHWYDPLRRLYYSHESDPANQKDLMAGKSFLDDVQLTDQTQSPSTTALSSPSTLGLVPPKEGFTSPGFTEPPMGSTFSSDVPKEGNTGKARRKAAKREIAAANGDPASSETKRGERKKRGSSLRKSGNSIEEINVYGGGEGGGGGEESEGD